MRILFVVNNPSFFVQHHLPVAEACQRKGYEVHVAAPDGEGKRTIESRGLRFHEVNIARGKLNLVVELLTIIRLVSLYRYVRPNLVHHLTHKPVLYGTLAARWANVGAVTNANTGLGFLFIDETPRTRVLRWLFQTMGRYALRHPNQVDLFLNEDDRGEFVARGLTRSTNSMVIAGPGVDPDEYPHAPLAENDPPIVVLPARLLSHKGVREFVGAARLLQERHIAVRCVLVGDPDPGNRASIDATEVASWVSDGVVEHWGHQTNMQAVYAGTTVCVLPSYREGLGRVLIEAASSGRPLIAFDVPGCRDVVRDGFNGLLVTYGDVQGLANAIERLATNHALCELLGAAGRRLVLDHFTVASVVLQTMSIHDEQLGITKRLSWQAPRRSPVRYTIEEVPV